MKYTIGKNPNSRNGFKRKYNLDESVFSNINILSSYWAGYLAADGYINNKYNHLNLTSCTKDEIILENFISFIKSDYKINRTLAKDKFPTSYLNIRSSKICIDLLTNFNITTKKSLTLVPPILDESCKDAYIVGYIDGDGCIGLYKKKRQKGLSISLLGTFEVCIWIKDRFEEIIGKKIGNLSKRYENSYSLQITDKNARIIFEHFYSIPVPKLQRKWSEEYLNHCINFSKFKNFEKINLILEYFQKGLKVKEIAKLLNMKEPAVRWYKYRKDLII